MPLRLRGLEVCLYADGQEIEQYQEDVVDETTIMCFVPSEVGQRFEVYHKQTDMDMAYEISMDGRSMEGRTVSGRPIDEQGYTRVEGVYSETTLQRFSFSQLQLVDDDSVEHSQLDVDKLGVIDIVARRFENERDVPYTSPQDIPTIGHVPEKAKKLGGHCVSLGQSEVTAERMITCEVDWLDDVDHPYAKFLFRYQPRDLLRAKGIIPSRRDQVPEESLPPQTRGKKRTSSPMASDRDAPRVKRETSPATTARTQALKEKIQATQAELAALEPQSVKCERSPSPIRVGTSNGEIIDLTLD
ncbi:hypothetical protein BV25DRAFT_22073 [Artomyces pyxidatus]|uniref:Uncharacterized protein n=1 Tax=Artomyces pyxidatus TaxID=48021 RepID=A0ACB8TJR7_9AGAM|nr:hypothetical protein BV25DRAFT_22073 [Artomyces pyxidatus]